MHKLSAKLSMSPKAPTNQRKKSNASTEADRRLARAQQLMDGNLERPTAPTSDTRESSPASNTAASVNSNVRPAAAKREEMRSGNRRDNLDHELAEPPRQKPQPVPVAPVQQKRSVSPLPRDPTPPSPATPTMTTAELQPENLPIPTTTTPSIPLTRPSIIPVSTVHPTVYTGAVAGTEPIPIPVMLPVIPTLIPGLTLPIGGVDMSGITLGAFAEYYGQMAAYDESNMPPTPTPSLASSIGNERMTVPRDMNASPVSPRSRHPSESEHSVASELSAAPDWLDEVVGPDDVDDDFSAMAAASEFMMSGSGEDGGSSRAQTPQPLVRQNTNAQGQQKRRTRREKRKRGGRNSGNESTSSVEKGHRNGHGKERGSKKTLAAELNEERRRREDEYLRNNSTGGLGDWPMPDLHLGSLIEADERAQGSRLWPPTPIGSRASLASQWTEQLQNTTPTPQSDYCKCLI
ncbi:hypothetical protein OESDEN_07761 [Oesophagostomum dentatum]|uniref:Uncharacterized protein n=1 Tax=Oesophagostomum dentatum TaxID=61180 RepID=A0A0B1T875_OESDE|nr:hypothetical protein OESDEN_07761 [Oesophagostomum dentatum]